MIGKYQLNFLEQDLAEAFSKRQHSAQRRMNYLCGFALLVMQIILAVRLIIYEHTTFHLVCVSLGVSVMALILNHSMSFVSTVLIFIQFILLHVQFTSEAHQDFIESLVVNDRRSEIFLIGLGFGSFSNIVLQSFSKWYVRSLALWASFALGFAWTASSFLDKLSSFLVPLYVTAIFSVISFYQQERTDKENFCLLFLQNKSLIDWQRIIKDNIPQSMVFVTRAKKGACKESDRRDSYSSSGSGNIHSHHQPPSAILERRGTYEDSNGLVFNFVNKRFFDQFKIKEWVEKQRNTIYGDCGYLSKPSLTEMLIKGDALKDRLTFSESPLHQILFNSIFKNIMMSKADAVPSQSHTSISDDNKKNHGSEKANAMVSLSEYLMSLMDEEANKKSHELIRFGNGINYNNNNNTSSRKVGGQVTERTQPTVATTGEASESFKALNCFYRPSSPSFVLEDIMGIDVTRMQTQEKQSQVRRATKGMPSNHNNQQQAADRGVMGNGGGTFAVLQTEMENLVQRGNHNIDSRMVRVASLEKNMEVNSPQELLNQQQQQESVKNTQREETLITEMMVTSPRFTGGLVEQHVKGSQMARFFDFDEKKKESEQVLIELVDDDDDNDDEEEMCEKHKDGRVSELTSKIGNKTTTTHSTKEGANNVMIKAITAANSSEQQHKTQKHHQQQQQQQHQPTAKMVTGNFLKQFSMNSDKHLDHYKPSTFKAEKEEKEAKTRRTNNEIQKNATSTTNAFTRLNDGASQMENTNPGNEADLLFFDTQMVSCNWGEEEGVLLIMNDVSLRIVNEKLREIESFKDKMLSTVTHDLKTPLNSIIMILENSIEMGELNAKQRQIILQNSHLLMSLINDILDYSQMQRDKFRLIIEEVNIAKCVMEVVDLFEIQAEQKRIQLKTKFKNLQQTVLMQDERRIKQILVNLIGNAMKFTQRDGSIKVVVKQTEPHCISIAIKDTGTGISEQIQKKLFQFFNTFDHSERVNNRHGIGLGLAICKQLNSQLGPWHEIKLKSETNKGSKFTFCLYVNLLNHQDGIEAVDSATQVPILIHPPPAEINIKKLPSPMQSENPIISNLQAGERSLSKKGTLQRQAATTGNMELASSYEKRVQVARYATVADQNSAVRRKQNYLQQLSSVPRINSPKRSQNNSGQKGFSDNNPNTSQVVEVFNHAQVKPHHHASPSQMFMKHRKSLLITGQKLSAHNSSVLLKMQEINNNNMSNNIGQLKRDPLKDFIIVKGHNNTNSSSNSYYNHNYQAPGNGNYQRLQRTKKDNRAMTTVRPVPGRMLAQTKNRGSLLVKASTSDSSNPRWKEKDEKKNSIVLFSPYSPSGVPSKTYLSQQDITPKENSNGGYGSVNGLQVFQFKPRSSLILQTTNSYGVVTMNSISQSAYGNSQQQKQVLVTPKQMPTPHLLDVATAVQPLVLNDQDTVDYVYQGTPSQRQLAKHRQKNSGMFVAVDAKSQMSFSGSFQVGRRGADGDDEEEACRSENFGEIEELQKRKMKKSKLAGEMQINAGGGGLFTEAIESEDGEDCSDSLRNKANKIDSKKQYQLTRQFSSNNQQQDEEYLDSAREEDTVAAPRVYSSTNKWNDGNNNPEEEEDDDEEEEQEEHHEDIDENQQQKSNLTNSNRVQDDRRAQIMMLNRILGEFHSILIADDSPFNIFCLEQILGKNGNIVITQAYDGQEALDSYMKNRQQIIFMDLNMPILDGYECMRAIREFEDQNSIEDRTKVIVVSAQEFEPFFCKFDGFISKPIKLIDIINTLDGFLQEEEDEDDGDDDDDNKEVEVVGEQGSSDNAAAAATVAVSD